jgi:hypothetical protein
MPIHCDGRKNYQTYDLFVSTCCTAATGHDSLICVGATFDIVSDCYNNFKRIGSLVETRMTMLDIYLFFIRVRYQVLWLLLRIHKSM